MSNKSTLSLRQQKEHFNREQIQKGRVLACYALQDKECGLYYVCEIRGAMPDFSRCSAEAIYKSNGFTRDSDFYETELRLFKMLACQLDILETECSAAAMMGKR